MVNVLGVTQKTLAGVLGMSEGWISQWLHGNLPDGAVSANHIDAIASFMKLAVNELSEQRPEPEPSEWPQPMDEPLPMGEGLADHHASSRSAQPAIGGNKRQAAAG